MFKLEVFNLHRLPTVTADKLEYGNVHGKSLNPY
jgi:hypothetical protein